MIPLAVGARMFVDEGDAVKRGTKIAQWDPYTRPILSEANGVVDFEDLIEGASVREQTDEMKGTSNRVIIDWRTAPRGNELKPAIVVKDSKGKPIKVARGGDAWIRPSSSARGRPSLPATSNPAQPGCGARLHRAGFLTAICTLERG